MEDNVRLRVASDALLRDLELLQNLEREKRDLRPDDPRFAELARQIEDLALHVLRVSERQREKGERLREVPSAGAAVTISDSPPRQLYEILAEWRDVERRLSTMPPDSLEARLAMADAERLRDEYQRAHRVLADRPARPEER